jgi:peroxiredoxin
MRRPRFITALILVHSLGSLVAMAVDPRTALGKNYSAPAGVGRELLGTRPPEWRVSEWLNGEPLTLAGLRGKVVLVRWWTGPECQFCTASAEALNGLWQKNRDHGLIVIGMYHHKADTPLTREHVAAQVRRLGFEFPIGIDEDWATLKQWWLGKQERGWTSVTFLLDREGVIRHIHPGGAYFPGEPGYAALEAAVEKALR